MLPVNTIVNTNEPSMHMDSTGINPAYRITGKKKTSIHRNNCNYVNVFKVDDFKANAKYYFAFALYVSLTFDMIYL